jgi:hypothetical protein
MNIIELAKRANGEPAWNGGVDWTWDELQAFAALVAAQEREACIKLVNEGTGEPIQTKTLFILQKDRKRIEDAIRARGTT